MGTLRVVAVEVLLQYQLSILVQKYAVHILVSAIEDGAHNRVGRHGSERASAQCLRQQCRHAYPQAACIDSSKAPALWSAATPVRQILV